MTAQDHLKDNRNVFDKYGLHSDPVLAREVIRRLPKHPSNIYITFTRPDSQTTLDPHSHLTNHVTLQWRPEQQTLILHKGRCGSWVADNPMSMGGSPDANITAVAEYFQCSEEEMLRYVSDVETVRNELDGKPHIPSVNTFHEKHFREEY